MNINKIICTGRLTKDPELRNVSEDMKVCRCDWRWTGWAVPARSATSTWRCSARPARPARSTWGRAGERSMVP